MTCAVPVCHSVYLEIVLRLFMPTEIVDSFAEIKLWPVNIYFGKQTKEIRQKQWSEKHDPAHGAKNTYTNPVSQKRWKKQGEQQSFLQSFLLHGDCFVNFSIESRRKGEMDHAMKCTNLQRWDDGRKA